MNISIGHYFLLIACSLTFLSVVIQYIFSDSLYVQRSFRLNTLIFISLSISLLVFISSFVESNFMIINVTENSHTQLPLLYKISASWGNHEGSMLLWTWIISFYMVLFSYQLKKLPLSPLLINVILQFQAIILFFFILFVEITSNPFLRLNFIISEGTELTPVLQDPVLSIHPPLIYFGYLALIINMTIVLGWTVYKGSLLKDEENFIFYLIRQWSLLSWTILTLGIALGSWWAYHELGWGGWWFWDPVENSSLMPWLAGLAILHTVQACSTSKTMHPWLYILSSLGFLLALVATFFVRSGFLESVHSFANDSERGLILLGFILISLFIVSYLFYRTQFTYEMSRNFLSRVNILLMNNAYLLIVILVILFATVYPSIYRAITNTGISIGETFFQSFLIPLLYPFLFLMGFVPSILTNSISRSNVIFILSYFTIGSALSYVLFSGEANFLLITQSCQMIILYLIYAVRKQISSRVILGHVAFFFFILIVCVSSIQSFEMNITMHIGDLIELNASQLIGLRDYNFFHGTNYKSSYIDISCIDSNMNHLFEAFPEKKFFYITDTYISKPYILSNMLQDIYVVLGEGSYSEGWSLKIHQTVGMLWLWISSLCIVLSGIYALSKKKNI